MKKLSIALFLILSILGLPTAHAADATQMPPSVDVFGKTLQLNGTALRTATVLDVKVYEAGLYLKNKSANAQQIIQSADPKVVRLRFLRDVSQSQVQDAWKSGFEKNCGGDCQALQPSFNQFVSKIPAAKTGDIMVYIISPKGVNFIDNGREVAQVNDARLGQVLLSTWIGKEPPSVAFKQSMLGIVPNVS